MIKEDYVSFEQAKKLKEVGFPQYLKEDGYIGDKYSPEGNRTTAPYANGYRCVSLSLAAKWLREEKKIYIDIISETNGKWENGIVYEYSIMKQDLDNLVGNYIMYDTYEEALSEGIDKALELINSSQQNQ